ncbi:type VII secretion system-associated protein [Streptomyces sp. rh34]|uniref:type VII secretion system-associated protein n=1 Tax=Streptomyces sp. rh34 TaxID=2034272 RepID=UPI000BEFC531|nr:type VII secretion system-associated protein [Streptomyces sp. rh34]
MAGEKADVKHFDLKQMENFRDLEVEPVRRSAKVHQEDTSAEGVRPLGDLVAGYTTAENSKKDQQILRIGKMGRGEDGDLVSGKTMLTAITTAATGIDKLLLDQVALFKELKEALTETIEEANKTKEKNIDAIDAQTLLQSFDEVDAFTVGGTGDDEETS